MVQAGDCAVIDPLFGSERSMLDFCERVCNTCQSGAHSVNVGVAEELHARIMVLSVISAVHTDSIHSQLLEVWQVTLASGPVRKGVNVCGRRKERIISSRYYIAYQGNRKYEQCVESRSHPLYIPCS